MRDRWKSVCLLLISFGYWCLLGINVKATQTYEHQLILQATERELDLEPYWLVLLHYRDGFLGFKSEVDSPDFFLSPKGKISPKKELSATIRAFLKSPDVFKSHDDHPQCLYPARFRWLKSKLSFEESKFPKLNCEAYQDWLDIIDGKSATLIFPSYYTRAPASMFGHVLLRINPKPPKDSSLLGLAINYSALIDESETNPLSYAWNGVFGGFPGVFSMQPYYETVHNYNDIESRDIWEYDLTFSEEEIEMMLAHLWELKRVWFDYYFFKENCSYHLLSLLEAARPGLSLRDNFRFWAIPSDVVKLVSEDKQLVSKTTYRPSRGSLIEWKLDQLKEEEYEIVLTSLKNNRAIEVEQLEPLSYESKERILDILIDYYTWKNNPNHDQLKRKILIRRAKIGSFPNNNINPPQKKGPDKGHDSSMVNLAAGHSEKFGFNHQLTYRRSFHDLMDVDWGYPPYNTIEIFKTTVIRHEERTQLKELTFLNVESVLPGNDLISRPLWKIKSTLIQNPFLECQTCYALNLSAGLGLGTGILSGVVYGFLDVDYWTGHELKTEGQGSASGRVGYILNLLQMFKLNFSAAQYLSTFTEHTPKNRYCVKSSSTISANFAVTAQWERFNDTEEHTVGINYYF